MREPRTVTEFRVRQLIDAAGTGEGVEGPPGPQGPAGPAGPAPSGTGYVHVTGGVLDTPAGLTKADVGLANVDNTADAAKVVASAAILTTARTINGVSFNGSANITVADSTKVVANGAITGATKTKLTYDAKGLVTAGVDATTADIADSSDRRYCTDAEKTVIGNTSGTNTGDQSSVSGNAGTATKLLTARNINGVAFDGTADITVADSTKVPTTRQVNGHALSADVTVTKSDVGLGNCDNTSDAAKPISTATQTALDAKQALLGFTPENVANKAAASGYASLDSGTKVPIAQLPTGTTSITVCIGNDSRLSDARTPTVHASTHAPGGSDALKVFGRLFAFMGA